MNKIIVISASGMGCTVMATPTLRLLRNKFPQAQIIFLGISESLVAPVRDSDLIDEVIVFDFAKGSLLNFKKLGQRLKLINKLRRQHFDVSITLFPSNKWYFNAFAWLTGSRKRITHRYPTSAWGNLGFLQNKKIAADPKLHDVEQNMNLLKPLGISPVKKPHLYFHIDNESRSGAKKLIGKLDEGKPVVGMHIGSSQDFDFAAKRWPTEKFVQLADRLQQELKARVIIFAGPDETSDVIIMKRLMKTEPVVVQEPIKLTAAIISECDLMITNDSGLMHIAVAMDTPVIAIFGPTNISRTRPYADNAEVVYDKNNNSLLEYPFTTTSAKLDSALARQCFKNITIDKVFAAAKKKLDG